jgi:DNA-binding NarL/FixJ family response regulator
VSELFEQLKPDLVVLDLAVPDMNGIEAARIMSVIDSRVPLILFTIFGFEGLETSATEAGIRAIIPKDNAWSLIPRIQDLARGEQTIN